MPLLLISYLESLGNPPTASLGVVESVDTSFIYNTTSQQISNMNFNSNGPLGPFTFAGSQPVFFLQRRLRLDKLAGRIDFFLAHFPTSAVSV